MRPSPTKTSGGVGDDGVYDPERALRERRRIQNPAVPRNVMGDGRVLGPGTQNAVGNGGVFDPQPRVPWGITGFWVPGPRGSWGMTGVWIPKPTTSRGTAGFSVFAVRQILKRI